MLNQPKAAADIPIDRDDQHSIEEAQIHLSETLEEMKEALDTGGKLG